MNPGVSKFINEILTYNDYNDIYSIRINEKNKLIGYTYDELLVKLRNHKILLLSISIENHREKSEVELIKQKFNLTRTVITNPITEEELNYKTELGDILIVLSQYESTIDKAIKSMLKDEI